MASASVLPMRASSPSLSAWQPSGVPRAPWGPGLGMGVMGDWAAQPAKRVASAMAPAAACRVQGYRCLGMRVLRVVRASKLAGRHWRRYGRPSVCCKRPTGWRCTSHVVHDVVAGGSESKVYTSVPWRGFQPSAAKGILRGSLKQQRQGLTARTQADGRRFPGGFFSSVMPSHAPTGGPGWGSLRARRSCVGLSTLPCARPPRLTAGCGIEVPFTGGTHAEVFIRPFRALISLHRPYLRPPAHPPSGGHPCLSTLAKASPSSTPAPTCS